MSGVQAYVATGHTVKMVEMAVEEVANNGADVQSAAWKAVALMKDVALATQTGDAEVHLAAREALKQVEALI